MNCKHENAGVEIIINNTLENCVKYLCSSKKEKNKKPVHLNF